MTVAIMNKKMLVEIMKTMGQTQSLMRKSRRMIMTMKREMNMAAKRRKTVSAMRETMIVMIQINHSQVQKKKLLMNKMKT